MSTDPSVTEDLKTGIYIAEQLRGLVKLSPRFARQLLGIVQSYEALGTPEELARAVAITQAVDASELSEVRDNGKRKSCIRLPSGLKLTTAFGLRAALRQIGRAGRGSVGEEPQP